MQKTTMSCLSCNSQTALNAKIAAWGTLTHEKVPRFLSNYATDKMAENRKIKSNMNIQSYEFQKEQKVKAKESLEISKEKKMKRQLDIIDEMDDESSLAYIDAETSEPFRRFLRELVEIEKKIEARTDDINELEDKIQDETLFIDEIDGGIELSEGGKSKGNSDRVLLNAINRRSAAASDKDKSSGEGISEERDKLIMNLEDSRRQRKIDAAKRGARSVTKDEDRMAKMSQEFANLLASRHKKGSASDEIILSLPMGTASAAAASGASAGIEKGKQPMKLGLSGVNGGGGGSSSSSSSASGFARMPMNVNLGEFDE